MVDVERVAFSMCHATVLTVFVSRNLVELQNFNICRAGFNVIVPLCQGALMADYGMHI